MSSLVVNSLGAFLFWVLIKMLIQLIFLGLNVSRQLLRRLRPWFRNRWPSFWNFFVILRSCFLPRNETIVGQNFKASDSLDLSQVKCGNFRDLEVLNLLPNWTFRLLSFHIKSINAIAARYRFLSFVISANRRLLFCNRLQRQSQIPALLMVLNLLFSLRWPHSLSLFHSCFLSDCLNLIWRLHWLEDFTFHRNFFQLKARLHSIAL
jgi:hypothetical protein